MTAVRRCIWRAFGSDLAASRLLQIGRRRIAHITGSEHFEAVQLGRTGYLDALAAACTTSRCEA